VANRGSRQRSLLSADGVERATAMGVAILKGMNATQAVVIVAITLSASRRPWLEVLAVTAYGLAGLTLVVGSLRAGRLRRGLVLVDVAIGIGVVLLAPLFQPSQSGQTWTQWPVTVTFLIGAEAGAVFSTPGTVLALAGLMLAASSWLLYDLPGSTRKDTLTNLVPYLGFTLGSLLFVGYLRRLAALADSRAATIRMLEEERTRRVLHTPYRLLNDLADMLRSEAARGEGDDPGHRERRARLAEAVASVHEIEAIVRGTEPASSNLTAELLRLREQFTDLPLVMNIDDVNGDLPPQAAYRIREAVRSALQNVRLYAHATEVVVYASLDATSWLVSVHDDGVGFEPSSRRGVGLGEVIVKALEEIGARVEVNSSLGAGTLVELSGDHRWTLTASNA
jgi:signal transduction histidine kinase